MIILVKDEHDKNIKFYINPTVELDLQHKTLNFCHQSGLTLVPIKVNDDYYTIIYSDYKNGINIHFNSGVDLNMWNFELKQNNI